MIKSYVVREVRLKVWLLNHSPAETARQLPRCTVDNIRKSLEADRKVIFKVRGDDILDAYIYSGLTKVHIYGFKG